MTQFLVFALYLCVSVMLLVVWPVMMHPTLPARRKILYSLGAFILFVPVGLALYAWLGVPQMAIIH